MGSSATDAAGMDSLIQALKTRFAATDTDPPWELAHYLLAFGCDSRIDGVDGPVSVAQFLATAAGGRSGGLLFRRRLDGAVFPDTDLPPRMKHQDHRNQIVAYMAITLGPPGVEASRPGGVRPELWNQILQGVWQDYSLRDEPSWTLICYLRYLSQLPERRASIIMSRIHQMAAVLIDPGRQFPLACGGAHARYALAELLKSPCADQLDGGTRGAVRVFLDKALDEVVNRVGRRGDPAVLPLDAVLSEISEDGHDLEWLAVYLPDARLNDPVVRRMASRLEVELSMVEDFAPASRGGIMHGIHSLLAFDRRITAIELDDKVRATPLNVPGKKGNQ